ncbi:MAG: nucleotidyltransferase substrate binding protein [Thermoguttaceae bacterium]
MSLELTSLQKAIKSFEKSLSDYRLAETTNNEHFLETLRAGVIQNFEFTYEISWKFIKRWVEENDSPTRVDGVTRIELFRVGAENRLIDDVPRWVRFHKARNATSHTYAADMAEHVFGEAKEFLPFAKELLNRLKERNA